MKIKLPKVDCKYGAPMARMSHIPFKDKAECHNAKVRLVRVYLDSGGYDSGGAYWGFGTPLYWCLNQELEISFFFRANNREEAKNYVRETLVSPRFFN